MPLGFLTCVYTEMAIIRELAPIAIQGRREKNGNVTTMSFRFHPKASYTKRRLKCIFHRSTWGMGYAWAQDTWEDPWSPFSTHLGLYYQLREQAWASLCLINLDLPHIPCWGMTPKEPNPWSRPSSPLPVPGEASPCPPPGLGPTSDHWALSEMWTWRN